MPSAELERARDWERAFADANAAAGGIQEVRTVNVQWQAERAGELPKDLKIEPVDAGGIPGEWLSIDGATETPVVLSSYACGRR